MGGSSDPSMILYRTKLIEKVGPIEGGSEAFNWTRGGRVERGKVEPESTDIGAARAKRKSLRAACCAKSNFATEARKKL